MSDTGTSAAGASRARPDDGRATGLPNAGAFVNGPVIHHFEDPGLRSLRPDCRTHLRTYPLDSVKSMPLDWSYLATEGGGAAGTPGYLAVDAADTLEFYAETTPVWWVPGRLFDLRDTYTTFYLKEIRPLIVAEGYRPFLFMGGFIPHDGPAPGRLSVWHLKQPVVVGSGEWAYNELFLSSEPDAWQDFLDRRPGDTPALALARCGFLGWTFRRGREHPGVRATGTLGWDEFAYNLTADDLADLKAGRPMLRALVF